MKPVRKIISGKTEPKDWLQKGFSSFKVRHFYRGPERVISSLHKRQDSCCEFNAIENPFHFQQRKRGTMNGRDEKLMEEIFLPSWFQFRFTYASAGDFFHLLSFRPQTHEDLKTSLMRNEISNWISPLEGKFDTIWGETFFFFGCFCEETKEVVS